MLWSSETVENGYRYVERIRSQNTPRVFFCSSACNLQLGTQTVTLLLGRTYQQSAAWAICVRYVYLRTLICLGTYTDVRSTAAASCSVVLVVICNACLYSDCKICTHKYHTTLRLFGVLPALSGRVLSVLQRFTMFTRTESYIRRISPAHSRCCISWLMRWQ